MRHIFALSLLAALAGCVSVGSINADTLGLKGDINTKANISTDGTSAPIAGTPIATNAPTAAPTLAPTPTPTPTVKPTPECPAGETYRDFGGGSGVCTTPIIGNTAGG
ncbi:MAG TPA: hypothetical protein V6D47_21610 [Oscillatoriaceae cyanobacterium]